jgi:hypothetical protein
MLTNPAVRVEAVIGVELDFILVVLKVGSVFKVSILQASRLLRYLCLGYLNNLFAYNFVVVAEKEAAVVTPTPSSQKVNAGSFKGYVAVYAKGYEGQRLIAKIGRDWVIVPALKSKFERITDFTGAGYQIRVRIYIDRVLEATINLTTK